MIKYGENFRFSVEKFERMSLKKVLLHVSGNCVYDFPLSVHYELLVFDGRRGRSFFLFDEAIQEKSRGK
jgi:hypothetical protein